MKLDMQVGLGPGHIVLGGDPAHILVYNLVCKNGFSEIFLGCANN